MSKDKSKSFHDPIKLWLVKIVLVFSVFCFSGFNPQVVASANASIKTELIESRIRKPAYSHIENAKAHDKLPLTSSLTESISYNNWAILNNNNVLASKYKSYRNRILLSSLSSIEVLFKLPNSSSQDETPFYKS